MTIEEFAAMTRSVITADGFEGYLPTACYPARRHLAVLEGIPANADVELASRTWAVGKAEADEEFLLAFKISARRFKVIRRIRGRFEERTFDIDQK